MQLTLLLCFCALSLHRAFLEPVPPLSTGQPFVHYKDRNFYDALMNGGALATGSPAMGFGRRVISMEDPGYPGEYFTLKSRRPVPLIHWSPNELVLGVREFQLEENDLIVINQFYSQGWTARAQDGTVLPVLKLDKIDGFESDSLIGVRPLPTTSIVTLRYQSKYALESTVISGFALVTMIGGYLWRRRQRH